MNRRWPDQDRARCVGGSTTISQVAPRPCQLPPHLLCSLVCQNFLKWFLSFWTPILHPPRPASPSPIRLWPPHSMVITFLRLFKDLMAISPPPPPRRPSSPWPPLWRALFALAPLSAAFLPVLRPLLLVGRFSPPELYFSLRSFAHCVPGTGSSSLLLSSHSGLLVLLLNHNSQ